jgi:hypothetical protein
MASGTHHNLEGIDYIKLYGKEPSAIEKCFAIYANVIELDENGQVLNAKYAEARATQYIFVLIAMLHIRCIRLLRIGSSNYIALHLSKIC